MYFEIPMRRESPFERDGGRRLGVINRFREHSAKADGPPCDAVFPEQAGAVSVQIRKTVRS